MMMINIFILALFWDKRKKGIKKMKHTIKYNGSVITLRFIRKCKWGNLIESELTPSKEQKRHFKLGIPTSGEAIRLDTLMCDTRRVKELVQTLTAIDM